MGMIKNERYFILLHILRQSATGEVLMRLLHMMVLIMHFRSNFCCPISRKDKLVPK